MSVGELYIGLMSGTSADAIDAALVDLSGQPRLLETFSRPYSDSLRQQVHSISSAGPDEIDRMGRLDVVLGREFAACVNSLLTKAQIEPSDVIAIGSHGQTIRHRPPSCAHNVKRSNDGGEIAFTMQIGDPNVIAELTSITTVADFRRRDMAVGGQGAPLVPAFHQAMFYNPQAHRVIVNIGGIANITWLPACGPALGFDTGPGNVLMDLWIQKHRQLAFDDEGSWAKSGAPIPELLSKFLNEPFFTQLPPKSTGRELFNRDWLNQRLSLVPGSCRSENVQATLLHLTAISICDGIKHLPEQPEDVLVCGGGARNTYLMQNIQGLLPGSRVTTTAEYGADPQWIEAMAFAWLAKQTVNRQPGNLCAVTGAKREVILGGIYYS